MKRIKSWISRIAAAFGHPLVLPDGFSLMFNGTGYKLQASPEYFDRLRDSGSAFHSDFLGRDGIILSYESWETALECRRVAWLVNRSLLRMEHYMSLHPGPWKPVE